MGLAKAMQALNEQKLIEERLAWEKKINEMSPGELLTNMGIDLDEAIEDENQNPTADIANRTREGMINVLRVARKSKNLHGLCKKELRVSAVRGAAALEVLRTRAVNSKDNDIPRLVKALREELEAARKEIQCAKDEAERLRKELQEEKKNKSRRYGKENNRVRLYVIIGARRATKEGRNKEEG